MQKDGEEDQREKDHNRWYKQSVRLVGRSQKSQGRRDGVTKLGK